MVSDGQRRRFARRSGPMKRQNWHRRVDKRLHPKAEALLWHVQKDSVLESAQGG